MLFAQVASLNLKKRCSYGPLMYTPPVNYRTFSFGTEFCLSTKPWTEIC